MQCLVAFGKYRKRFYGLGIGLCLFLNLPAWAQHKQTTYQQLVWGRFNQGLVLSEKWEMTNEIEERRFIFPDKQHQLLFRSTLLYKLPHQLQPGAGFTYFLQSPHDPRSASRLMVPELRPHQEINFRSQLGERWSLRQRFKLEERFYRKVKEGELASGYNFNFRLRFKADLFYTLLQDRDKKDQLVLLASNEVMLNAGKEILYNVFDQNRVYGGLRWNTGANTAVEGGYLWWYQQRTNGQAFYHRNILRFTFYHKLTLWKKES